MYLCRYVTFRIARLHIEKYFQVCLIFQNWMADKEEVQLVDMVLRIRNKLAEATDQNLPLPDVISDQLSNHVETILQKLPQDLQLVLKRDTYRNNDNGEDISTLKISENINSEMAKSS